MWKTTYAIFPFMFQHTHAHTFVLVNCSRNNLPTYSHGTLVLLSYYFPFTLLSIFQSCFTFDQSSQHLLISIFYSQMHIATKMSFQSTSYTVCTFLCPTHWTGGRAALSPWSSTRASVVSTMLVNLLFYT